MNRLPNAMQRLVVALIVGIITIPAASTALFLNSQMKRSADEQQAITVEVMRSNAERRAQERAAFHAVEDFQKGTSVRDRATKPAAGTDPAEVDTGIMTSSASTEDLSVAERELLRKYVRARACPESLKLSPVSGFYELCLSLVGAGVSDSLPKGLINHTAYLNRTLRSAASTLSKFKLRMQMLDQAENGEKRTGGVLPGRPTNCVKSADCR